MPHSQCHRYDPAMIEPRHRLAEALRDAIACAEDAHDDRSLPHLHAASRMLRETLPHAPIQVDIISGRVFKSGCPVPVSRAELAVVILLALKEYGLSGEELGDALYPDADACDGLNAVKVTIFRVRRRIGIPNTVRFRSGRYSLGEPVEVELRRIERSLRRWRTTAIFDSADRDALERLRLRLIPSRPPFMQNWTWFQSTERWLRELYREVTTLIARDALRTDRLERAIELAGDLAETDPLDEAAAEIGIRGFLRLGDRTSALVAYHRYAVNIRRELSLSPPQTISALLS